MKEIKLSQGMVALVDDEDYDYLNQWKWCVTIGAGTYYAVRKINNRLLRMHRLILNAPNNFQVDHIDHNGLNNQRSNIRLCNNSQNHMNRKPHGNSKYLGVSFKKSRNKFEVGIKVMGKMKHLGYYDNENDAARIYDKVAKKYFGEFANLNFK
jgi:hypothetical protein